jgi:hypothetical protein
MFAGIQNGQAAMAFYNNKYNATLAASIQYVNYGKFTRTDENGNKQGNFSGNDIAMQVGFGKTLNKYFSYGANAKFLASYLDNLLATAVAIDLSTTYADTAKRISISLLIKNAGVQLKGYQPRYYNDESFTETVPTDIQIGITKRLKHLPFSLNVAAHHLYKWDIRYDNPADRITNTIVGADTVAAKTYFADKLFRHMVFGGEFYFGKSLSIQLGYNHLRRQELKTSTRNGLVGFSCGFHFKTNRFTIGYAHAWYYLPSATNTLALSFHL